MNRSVAQPLLLDTHYWIWLQLGERTEFSSSTLKAVTKAAGGGSLLLSVISIWELGMLEAKGRLRLNSTFEQWMEEALVLPGLTVVPLTPEIALASSRLPEPFHADAAARIIVATARTMGARIVTRDAKILEYGRKHHVATL